MSAEDLSKPKIERGLVSYEDSLRTAKKLLESHKLELDEAGGSMKAFDEDVSPFKRDAIGYFLKSVPVDIQANSMVTA